MGGTLLLWCMRMCGSIWKPGWGGRKGGLVPVSPGIVIPGLGSDSEGIGGGKGGGLVGVCCPFRLELVLLSGVPDVLVGDLAARGWWLWLEEEDPPSCATVEDASTLEDLRERRLRWDCLCGTFCERFTGSPESGDGCEGRGSAGGGSGGVIRSSMSTSSLSDISWPLLETGGWVLQSRSQSSGVMSPDATLQAAPCRCGCILRWACVSLQNMFILY